MLSANDVKNVTFSKQVNGYRREEVDVFLDKVESDYENYERMLKEMNARIHELETQIADTKNSEGTIQSVLLSAQKLADNIVAEAKEKSGKIIEDAKLSLENFKAHEQELSGAFDKKAQERKQMMRDQLDRIIDEAKVNRDKISEATEKTVKKQAELYNRLRLETAAFKAEIMEKYKKQLELISKIPDTIPTNPEEIAAAVDLKIEDLSDREKFISGIENTEIKSVTNVERSAEPAAETVQSVPDEKPEESAGFVVNTEFKPEDE